MTKELNEITKKEFIAYERVRQSGLLNMWSPQVSKLAGISQETHEGIIRNYFELDQKWPDVRQADLWEGLRKEG